MKKIFLLGLLIGSSTMVFATIIKISVTDFQFSPKTVNAKLGDTVVWIWKKGVHTTTSTSIPVGAVAWDKPIDASHRRFGYILKRTGTYQYQCTFHFTIGMVGTINVTNALSAGLNSFTVSSENANAILNWKTISPKDVNYFSVQKSIDGDNFKEIAQVKTDGSNEYKFTDKNNASSKYVYYQIEMVDTKGSHELSSIQMFTQRVAAGKLITSISPNPISSPGHLMLQFNADKEGVLKVQLYNQAGAFVKETQMSAYKGLNNGHFHLGDLTPGSYYIVCTLGEIKEKHTIVVK